MNKSIVDSIQKLLFLTLLFIGVVLFLFLSFFEYQRAYDERSSVSEAYLRNLNKSVVKPISEGNYILAESFFDLRYLPPYFQSIKYFHDEGEEPLINKEKKANCTSVKQKFIEVKMSKAFDTKKLRFGTIALSVSYCDIKDNLLEKLILFLCILVFLFWSLHILISIGITKILKPLKINTKKDISLLDIDLLVNTSPVEIKPVLISLKSALNEANNLRLGEEKLLVSKQLAHDIRSPLSALDMSIKSLDRVDPSQKQLIRSAINRIHDIANNLVGKNEKINNDSSVESTLLSSVLSQIISEKRTEYRNLNKIVIDFPFSNSEYGLFSKISSYELKRIISNLINNSIEANDKDEGFIEVRLENTTDSNKIIITDNGKGISKENIDSIFKEGVSIDKSDGTGLGLFHAKSTIESWKGSITCKSELGLNTIFTITLPKSKSPSDFVKEIIIDSNLKVVIVDDDSSIHQVWKGRLESLQVDTSNISIFSDPEKFLAWYEVNKDENATYLFDYEFLGHDLNGLSLVENVSASKKYLVTSRYEEDHIKKKCKERSRGLIDKGMIGFVPMSLEKEVETKPLSHILIDDDDLIHMSWKLEAKNNKVKLDCYFTVEDFLSNCESYLKDSIIYIDSNLANGLKGEVESKKIYEAGFKTIYLTTGYAPSDFDRPSWIKDILGKRAKFD